jgi:hypothetical protein
MEIKIEFWQLVGLAITIGAAFAAIGKALLLQTQRQIEQRLEGIEEAAKADQAQWQRVERELFSLKAELPLHYVRREDYVQAIATIMTKLDSMALRFENILLRGDQHRER